MPDAWKEVNNVAPIFKKGNKHKLSSYRPCSLINMYNNKNYGTYHCKYNLMKHLEIQNIYYFLFSIGFRRNYLICESQLISLFQDVLASSRPTIQTDMLNIDVSKAFDKVPHKRINYRYKLNVYTIRRETLE